jgi:ABC-type lipoprotein export system ATPase subunit
MIEAPAQEPRGLESTGGVRVELVSRTFVRKRGPVQALSAMTLRARPREIVAVVGPSGCGKTTLLELICGLQRPDSGTVDCAPAALMPQSDLLLPWLGTVDNAALALRARGVGRQAARELVAPWIERFGLAGFEDAKPAALSGGMRQRVSFLRSMLADVLLTRGRPGEACAASAEALRILESLGDIETGEALVRVVHAECLQATGDVAGACAAARNAHERIAVRADRIPDATLRASFLEQVPANARTLLRAREWLGL